MLDWPDWWSWELELTPHLLKHMVDRQFNELDPRVMRDNAFNFLDNDEEGRFLIETRQDGRRWNVIVEPSSADEVLIVVTAYPVD